MGKRIWWSKPQNPNKWDLPDDLFVTDGKPDRSDWRLGCAEVLMVIALVSLGWAVLFLILLLFTPPC